MSSPNPTITSNILTLTLTCNSDPKHNLTLPFTPPLPVKSVDAHLTAADFENADVVQFLCDYVIPSPMSRSVSPAISSCKRADPSALGPE